MCRHSRSDHCNSDFRLSIHPCFLLLCRCSWRVRNSDQPLVFTSFLRADCPKFSCLRQVRYYCECVIFELPASNYFLSNRPRNTAMMTTRFDLMTRTRMTLLFLCRCGTIIRMNRELAYINPVATKLLIACFERHGSGRMLIPAGVFIIAR
jgi:hypothetical protein